MTPSSFSDFLREKYNQELIMKFGKILGYEYWLQGIIPLEFIKWADEYCKMRLESK